MIKNWAAQLSSGAAITTCQTVKRVKNYECRMCVGGHLFQFRAGVESYVVFVHPVHYEIGVTQFFPMMLCCAVNLDLKCCWCSSTHIAEGNTALQLTKGKGKGKELTKGRG